MELIIKGIFIGIGIYIALNFFPVVISVIGILFSIPLVIFIFNFIFQIIREIRVLNAKKSLEDSVSNFTTLVKMASKHKSREEFQRKDEEIFNLAKSLGWVDEICHLLEWNKKRCAEEARKYKTRADFQKNSDRAFMSAFCNGWLDEICAHMNHD